MSLEHYEVISYDMKKPVLSTGFFMIMQIFFPGGKSASDVTLLFVHVQDFSHICCQERIDRPQTFCTVFMFGCH